MKNRLINPQCYCGYHRNDSTLCLSASGGLATALAEQIISDGGVVYGVIHSEGFDGAEYARATSLTDLKAIQGTKYVDVKPVCQKENVYEKVLTDLRNGQTVLFIGLPCMVAAMEKRAEKDNLTEPLITVDLFCHGPTSPIISKEYAEIMRKRRGCEVIDIQVRHKKNGEWIPPYLKVIYSDGKATMQPFTATEYAFAFRVLAQNRCYSCGFKGDKHFSDLTIGDYWGINKADEGYNSHGVSVAVVHTREGLRALNNLQNFMSFEISYEKAIKLNPYYEKPRTKDPRHDRFELLLKTKGLKAACDECMTAKERIRRYIPQSLINLIHRS